MKRRISMFVLCSLCALSLRWLVSLTPAFLLSFSTGFSSVHGERPSAEYAKLRKQSLESEFGHALNYSSKRLSTFYRFGPFLALYRAAIISYYAVKLTMWQLFVHDTKKRSIKVISQYGPNLFLEEMRLSCFLFLFLTRGLLFCVRLHVHEYCKIDAYCSKDIRAFFQLLLCK